MKRKNEIIIILINILVIITTLKTNIFGSTLDFLNQHIVFPEYLRNTFYETGKIIPSTITIGGIENIYNIAYYGLLNPIILISYLFPFIKMIDYIIISNIILLISSSVLFYKFMKTKFNDSVSITTTLLFSLSGPLIFQFHRHFMFVNYMPFLILALINIEKNKKINLIIDIFLIIMTSFYYSIPSIMTIVIYYIYKNFKNIKEISKIMIYITIPILMSGIMLLPTLEAILGTRTNGNAFDITLLIPNINLDNILYGAYSVGLTSIAFIALIYLVYTKKKENIFLAVSILIMSFIPLVLYLLNGGLYLRGKALIPLLPLLTYIIGIFIKDLIENKIEIKKFLILVLITNIIVLIKYHVIIYYIDLMFMIILILLYNKTKKQKIITIPLIILNLVICIALNNTETYISKKTYNEVNTKINIDTNYRITNINNNNYTVNKYTFTTNIYSSTINKYYSDLYHNTFKINKDTINNLELTSTTNVLFNEYMGVKYIVSNKTLNNPYKKIDNNIYELEQTLPIGYVNPNTVNKEYYEKLEYPYNLDILMNYIIDEKSTNKPTSNIEEIKLNYTYKLGENITIKDNKLYASENSKIIVNIEDNLENKLLFIDIYNQEEQENDIALTINGQTNLLTKKEWLYPNKNNTFHYCIEGNSTLEINLTKGIYNVENIKTYILDNNYIKNINDNIDKYDIIKMNSEIIKGNINVKNSGYFMLSIPYDKGFYIKVNGKEKKYELINNTFIGFYLDKGNYDIEITYNPPLLKEGKIISIVGTILLIVAIKERKIYEKNCNYNIISNNRG